MARITPSFLVALVTTLQLPPTSQDRFRDLAERGTKAYTAGHYEKAYEYFKRAYRHRPKHQGIKRNLAVVSYRIGTKLLQDRQPKRALDAFRRATIWTPKEPAAWFAVAHLSNELDRHLDAENAFKQTLRLNPEHFEAQLRLGILFYEQKRYGKAIVSLERAKKMRPKDPRVRLYLTKAVSDRDVERTFRGTQSSHFELSFNGNKKELSNHTAEIIKFLERSYEEISRHLSHRPGRRIAVVLYTKTEFGRLARKADWAGAFYDGKVRVPVDSWARQKSQVKRSIKHELSHAFLHSLLPGASPWIQEGFAQWVEGARVDRARDQYRHRKLFRSGAMRRPFMNETDPELAKLLYAESLCLFAHLLESRDMDTFRWLLQRIGGHKGDYKTREDEALRHFYRKDLDGLILEMAKKHRLVAPSR